LFKSKFDSVIKDKEKSGKTLNVKGIVGPFVDQETILSFKNFLNKLGSSDLYIQNPQNCLNFGNVDIDDRANYLLSWNEHLQNSQEMGHNPDFFLLIGTNPRFEASTFNIRLRRIILQSTSSSTKSQNPNFKNIPLAYIGEPMDLTYPSHHIGSGSKDLVFLSQGKDIWSKNFLKAKRPLPIMGFSPLQRKDGYSCLKAMDILTIYHNKIRNILKEKNESIYSLSSGFNVSSLFSTEYFLKSQKPLTITNKWFIPSSSKSDISILHPYASTAGAFDLGFYPGKTSQIFQNQKNSDTDFVFLLGADEKKNYVQVLNQGKKDFQTDNKPFVLYQGHHGDLGAKQADLILPSTSYVEKKGTYVNTEGLVQRTDTIGNMQVQSSVDNEAHDD